MNSAWIWMWMDVLTSVCVHVVKMCVSKEWNLQYNSLHEPCGCKCGPGHSGCCCIVWCWWLLWSLIWAQGGQEVFPGSSCTSDNPSWHGHEYTRRHQNPFTHIHMHKNMHRFWHVLMPSLDAAYSCTSRHMKAAETCTLCSDVSGAFRARELALLKSNCTQANYFFLQCQLVVGSDVAVCATQLAMVTST